MVEEVEEAEVSNPLEIFEKSSILELAFKWVMMSAWFARWTNDKKESPEIFIIIRDCSNEIGIRVNRILSQARKFIIHGGQTHEECTRASACMVEDRGRQSNRIESNDHILARFSVHNSFARKTTTEISIYDASWVHRCRSRRLRRVQYLQFAETYLTNVARPIGGKKEVILKTNSNIVNKFK